MIVWAHWFSRRAVLEAENTWLREQLATVKQAETYWRTRAEKFLDAAAGRAGLIVEPTMRDRSPFPTHPIASALQGLGISSISGESTGKH